MPSFSGIHLLEGILDTFVVKNDKTLCALCCVVNEWKFSSHPHASRRWWRWQRQWCICSNLGHLSHGSSPFVIYRKAYCSGHFSMVWSSGLIRSYSSVGRAVGQLGRARYRFVFSRLENIVPRKQKIGTLFIIETISEMQEQQQQWQQHLKLQEKSPGHSFVFDKKHRFISFCVCHITLCRTVSFGC